MKNLLIGFFLAFTIFLIPRSVSASSFGIPDSYLVTGSDSSFYDSCFNQLKSNPSFSKIDNGIVVMGGDSSSLFLYIISPEDIVEVPSLYPKVYNSSGVLFAGSLFFSSSFPTSQLSSFNFTLTDYDPSSFSQLRLLYITDFSSNMYPFPFDILFAPSSSYNNPSDFYMQNYGISYFKYYSVFENSISYEPDYVEVPVGFSYDVDDFYTWIINNNKLSQLPSYIIQSKLKSFLEFYKNFGSSNNFFISKIADWFSYVSIPSQSFENIRALKSATDQLYKEYLDYRSSTHAYWPGATKLVERDDIDTVTNNNNISLITDDNNDDIYTKLLRDILRGIIAISNNVVQGCSDIVNKLDHLNFDVIVSNNGGLSFTDLTPVIDKMDDIIEALQADTVSVDIDQNTQDSTDDFFNDWNDAFSLELESKFPVASDLHTLFSDDFFEKCGIDYNGDGEVYSYYNAGVYSSRSAGSSSSSSESTIVTEFLSQFDDADVSFLDDASFSESVPDWSVTIGGNKVSIFNFKIYAKYRSQIHFIIGFIAWTFFLLGFYKSLPSIIGGVASTADVIHSFDDTKKQ